MNKSEERPPPPLPAALMCRVSLQPSRSTVDPRTAPFSNQVVTGSARKLHEIVQTKATLKQGRQLPSTGFVRPVYPNWQSLMREGRTENWALEIRLGGVPQFSLTSDDDGCGEAGGGKTGQRTPGPGPPETTGHHDRA